MKIKNTQQGVKEEHKEQGKKELLISEQNEPVPTDAFERFMAEDPMEAMEVDIPDGQH